MPIEFRCTSCQQQLRVPDDSAGKNAKCPKCGAIVSIPPPGGLPPPSSPPPVTLPPATTFRDAALPAGGNPFASDPPAKPSLNPYASPGAGYTPPTIAGGYSSHAFGVATVPIRNQPVSIGDVWNHSWQVWQSNLGLLVGVSVVAAIINNGVSVPFSIIQMILQHNDAQEAAIGVSILSFAVSMVVQTFLNIGQINIALKLARQQPANFSDLFAGGSRLLPLLGLTLLTMVPLLVAFALLIVPGVLLTLVFWPCYLLVIDGRSRVFDSFSIAYNITEGNRMTTFLMWLMSLCVMFVGFLMCCVGILAAAPLATIMWATAYLMMSGQIPVPQMTLATPGYYPPLPQMPGK